MLLCDKFERNKSKSPFAIMIISNIVKNKPEYRIMGNTADRRRQKKKKRKGKIICGRTPVPTPASCFIKDTIEDPEAS